MRFSKITVTAEFPDFPVSTKSVDFSVPVISDRHPDLLPVIADVVIALICADVRSLNRFWNDPM